MGYYEPGPDSAAGRDEKPANKIVAILLFRAARQRWVYCCLVLWVWVNACGSCYSRWSPSHGRERLSNARAAAAPFATKRGGARTLLPGAAFSPMGVVWALGGDRARADGRSPGGSGSRAGGYVRTQSDRK